MNRSNACVAAALVASSCGGDAERPERASCELRLEIPAPVQTQVEVLVVVDTSLPPDARAEAVESIGDRLVETLGREDLHLAVVSADLGVGDAQLEGCDATGDEARFLGTACTDDGTPFFRRAAKVGGSVAANYQGSLADALACALPEPEGCAIQQPLEAATSALEAAPADFFRDLSGLSILFVAGRDDCSAADPAALLGDDPELGPAGPFRCAELGLLCDGEAPAAEPATYESCRAVETPEGLTPLASYLERWNALAPHGELFNIGIAGGALHPFEVEIDPDTGEAAFSSTCGRDAAVADPPVRLASAARWFHNARATICRPREAGAIVRAPRTWDLANPCLPDGIAGDDLAPHEPGIQLDCHVAQTDEERGNDQTIPACTFTPEGDVDPAPRPCWRVEESPACSVTDHQLQFTVERHANPPELTRLSVRCACPVGDGGR